MDAVGDVERDHEPYTRAVPKVGPGTSPPIRGSTPRQGDVTIVDGRELVVEWQEGRVVGKVIVRNSPEYGADPFVANGDILLPPGSRVTIVARQLAPSGSSWFLVLVKQSPESDFLLRWVFDAGIKCSTCIPVQEGP